MQRAVTLAVAIGALVWILILSLGEHATVVMAHKAWPALEERLQATPVTSTNMSYVPIAMRSISKLVGRVTFEGRPYVDAKLELNLCKRYVSYRVVYCEERETFTTTTDVTGYYEFKDVPYLNELPTYGIRPYPDYQLYWFACRPYRDPPTYCSDPRLLSQWTSRSVTQYRRDDVIEISTFDVANVKLVSPEGTSPETHNLKLPIVFKWRLRDFAPNDTYQLCVRENPNMPVFQAWAFCTDWMKNTDTYTVTSLQSVSGSNYFVWTVNVKDRTGGTGYLHDTRSFLWLP